MDDFTESQKKFLNNLFTNLNSTINEKTSEIRAELKTQINDIKEKISPVITTLQQKVDTLEKENNSLKQNIGFLERKVRKNNLVVFGIDRNAPILNIILRLFNETLEVPIESTDINDVYRLNTKNKNHEPPIIVEFTSFQQKLSVLKNAKNLKGKKISITNDLIQEDRETNKVLLKHRKLARNKGKTAYIKGNKLVIENCTYTAEQLQNEELEVQDIELEEKIDSAPPTPNPEIRQKRLLHEFGLEEQKQEPKKLKTTSSNFRGLEGDSLRISTRSNSTSRKGQREK